MNLLTLDRWSRTAGFITLLPATVLVSVGMLHLVFGVNAANGWLDAALKTQTGRVVFSPVTVLGGVLFAMTVNVAFVCRFWPSWDEDYVALTVSLRRQWARLLQLGIALALLGCLLTYSFVENFRIVPR